MVDAQPVQMQLPPIEVLLSWPPPNYVDPKDVRGPQLLIITFVLFPIALISVALRTFTRLYISKSFGADDWFLLVAVVPTAACAVLTILALQKWGWNRHERTLPDFSTVTPEFICRNLRCIGVHLRFQSLSSVLSPLLPCAPLQSEVTEQDRGQQEGNHHRRQCRALAQ